MGYSCSANASDRLNMVLNADTTDESSNTWVKNGTRYFFERGRENADGSVTGTVFEIRGKFAHRKGSAKIDPNGKVVRFPHWNAEMKTAGSKPLPSFMVV